MDRRGCIVLAGAASYAASEALGWPEGLDRRVREASGFYAIIASAVIVGLLLVAIGVDPIKALIAAAVFNGVAAVPLVFCIGMVARDEAIMGEQRSRVLSQTLIWTAFAAMAASSLTLFATLIDH
jgi:Mn2+/Fe2+ NRAMP family transporter